MDKKKADLAANKYDASLAELNRTIGELKSQLSVLRRERDELSSMAAVAGKVQLLNRDADEKNAAATSLFEKCQPRLKALYGAEVRVCRAQALCAAARHTRGLTRHPLLRSLWRRLLRLRR